MSTNNPRYRKMNPGIVNAQMLMSAHVNPIQEKVELLDLDMNTLWKNQTQTNRTVQYLKKELERQRKKIQLLDSIAIVFAVFAVFITVSIGLIC